MVLSDDKNFLPNNLVFPVTQSGNGSGGGGNGFPTVHITTEQFLPAWGLVSLTDEQVEIFRNAYAIKFIFDGIPDSYPAWEGILKFQYSYPTGLKGEVIDDNRVFSAIYGYDDELGVELNIEVTFGFDTVGWLGVAIRTERIRAIPKLTFTSEQIISQEPLKLQLTSEHYNLIANSLFIELDASILGFYGRALMTQAPSSAEDAIIFTSPSFTFSSSGIEDIGVGLFVVDKYSYVATFSIGYR